MAGSRTLKLSILGDVDSLNKSLKAATADVDTFGDKMGKAGKAIGAAFAAAAVAAGAYAIKIGVDGVKAALEDEKAQRILAQTLENTTGATVAQIAAVEDYITQTSLAVGVTDDELRPAFSRLVRSTKDTEEAQKLLNLALDISSATGKPLEAIANSLGKAYDGNTNALGKLGLGIDQSILKTKNFNLVYDNLRTSFAGFAANEANTFQGRLDRMKVAFDEAKESIGFALLPVLEKLMKYINQFAQPILDALNAGFDGKTGLGWYLSYVSKTIQTVFTPVWNGLVDAFGSIKTAIGDNLESFKTFGAFISTYLAPVIGTVLGGALKLVGQIAASVINVIADVIDAITPMINFAVAGINKVITGLNYIKPGKDISYIPKINAGDAPEISIPSTTNMTMPTIPSVSGGSSFASSGSTGGGGGGVATVSKDAAKAAADAAKLDAQFQNAPGYSTSAYAMEQANVDAIIRAVEAKVAAAPVTVNMGVVGDPEAAARAIVDVLNRSSGRGALGAEALIL